MYNVCWQHSAWSIIANFRWRFDETFIIFSSPTKCWQGTKQHLNCPGRLLLHLCRACWHWRGSYGAQFAFRVVPPAPMPCLLKLKGQLRITIRLPRSSSCTFAVLADIEGVALLDAPCNRSGLSRGNIDSVPHEFSLSSEKKTNKALEIDYDG